MMANGNSSINGLQKSGFPNKINLELLQTNTSNKPLNQGKNIKSASLHTTTDEISNHANVEKNRRRRSSSFAGFNINLDIERIDAAAPKLKHEPKHHHHQNDLQEHQKRVL